MKRVITQNSKNLVLSDHTRIDNYYGVDFNFDQDTVRGFISFNSRNSFIVLLSKGITRGQTTRYVGNTLKELIDLLIEAGHDVYEFERFIDLMSWIAETH